MKKVATTLMISLALAAATQAAVTYSNNFDDETLGTFSGGVFVHSGASSTYGRFVAGDSYFPTPHIEIGSRTDNYNFGFSYFDGSKIDPAVTFPAMICFKFDVVLNEGGGMLRLRPKNVANEEVVRFDVTSSLITTETVHTIELFINNTTSDQKTIYGVLPTKQYAVYSDGVSIASGDNRVASDNTGIDYQTLWVNGNKTTSTQGIVRIDNWEINDAVPDRSLSLMGIK